MKSCLNCKYHGDVFHRVKVMCLYIGSSHVDYPLYTQHNCVHFMQCDLGGVTCNFEDY